ncbi:MAG: class I SAM-dependent methyltransferase [Actinobacteria bacterium]|nr:class I SAM-dependent methyltransferase [Actinomycetota bacterium]
MIDWGKRLSAEWPFFKSYFDRYSMRSILDIGCGTGEHAIFFSEKGYKVIGIDPSSEMIRVAREKVSEGVNSPEFLIAGFEQISDLGGSPFDCVLCIGNTLPYVESESRLLVTLKDISNSLGDNGIFITQSRNFDLMKKGRNRFLPISSYKDKVDEKILLRFYDVFENTAVLNLVEINNVDGSWEYTLNSSSQFPLFKKTLIDSLANAGFKEIELFGDFKKSAFDIGKSADLIIVAGCQ